MIMPEVLFVAVVASVMALVLPIIAFLYAASLRGRVRAVEDRLARIERWMQGGAPKPAGTSGQPAGTAAAASVPPAGDARSPVADARSPVPPPAGDAQSPGPPPAVDAWSPGSPPAADARSPGAPPAAWSSVHSPPASPAGDVQSPGPPPASAERPPSPLPAVAGGQPGLPPPGSAEPPRAMRLETRIGTRWMLYAGVAILVIGVGLFIRYAFANAWITEPLRVWTGALAGGLLIRSGRRFAAHGHARFGATIAGGGLAAWYLAAFAALNLYGLVGPAAGFAMFTAVSATAAFQADRLRAQPLAVMAVVGGFAAPFLVGGADAQVVLFTYVALLVGAVVHLARRRDWPGLNLAAFALTGLTVLVWYARSYEPGDYLLTEAFFTLYAGLFLWVRHRSRASTGRYARTVRWVLATTPLWYHAASLVILADHRIAFLIYLIAFTGAGVAVAARRGAMWPRTALWAGVAGPLLGWGGAAADISLVPSAGVAWTAIAGLHTAVQIELLRRRGGPLHAADVVLVPLNGFALAVGLQVLLTPYVPGVVALSTALTAALWWGVSFAVQRIDPRASMHWLMLAGALGVGSIGLRFDGAWGALACAAQAAGLAWLGIRERRAWIRAASAGLLGAAALLALAEQTAPLPAVHAVLLNRRALLGLFVAAACAFVAWLHRPAAGRDLPRREAAVAAAVVAANVLLLFTLSTEILAFWELRREGGRFAADAEFAGQMMLSATWAAYAAALTAAGIRRQYAPVRYLALVIFGATVLKVFIVDFSQLDSVYRIATSLVLGVLLLAASYLYQRQ